MSIADLRKEYTLGGLNETDLEPNPFKQFERWFDDAVAEKRIVEANAMTVATAAIGVNHGRRWGLALGIIYLFEMEASNLIFMMTYMNDLSEARNVRLSGLVGIASVLILLYLWIRARDLLFE